MGINWVYAASPFLSISSITPKKPAKIRNSFVIKPIIKYRKIWIYRNVNKLL